MGIGNLVLEAARQAAAGATVDDIVRVVEDQREHQKVLATLDTLEYLKKGGRIGGARALVGSMLSIKPVIEVRDGVVAEGKKVRTRARALQYLVDAVSEDKPKNISVLHAGAPDLDEFLKMLETAVPGADVVVGTIGPVVGVHTGPRVIGVAWIPDKE
jgi:DegV family protein with EDD domain